ncbi:MAG: DUF397 domain-containing protein [Pseudonocardiaceae bacterium]
MPALDLSGARWHKSSHSTDMANCVEVAFVGPVVALRDSKNPTGGVLLAISPPAWSAFATALRTGELDC